MTTDIHTHAAALAPEPKKKANSGPSRRGVGAATAREKRSAARDPDAPRRTSLRIKGEQADGKYIVEERQGKLITTEGAFEGGRGSGWRPQEGRAADDVVRARHPPGLVAFASLNQGDDARYLKMLREAAASGAGGGGEAEGNKKVDEDEDAPILKKRASAASASASGPAAATSSFVSSLAAAAAATPAAAAAAAASPSTATAFAASTLAERDVVKVVRDGCVHLAWHPGGGSAILASADKKGAVSLFDADWASSSSSSFSPSSSAAAGEDAEAADEAGVLEFAPHHSYVCGLKWAGGGRLFTASYDGSVRVLDPSFGAPPPPGNSNLGTAGGDVEKNTRAASGGVFAPAILHTEAEWSAFDCSDDGRLGIVADKGGEALLFDPRAGAASAVSSAAAADAAANAAASAASAAAPPPPATTAPPPRPTSALPKCVVAAFSLHEKKINTLSIDCAGGGNLFAASASDGSIRIFDLRKLVGSASTSPSSGKIRCDLGADSGKRAKAAKPVMEGGHAQSCQGAFFAPDGSGRLVSTSRDNTVKIWSTKISGADSDALAAPLVSIRHDNNTGRWITPFRAVFTPRGDGVVVGGMRRTIDVYSSADGRQLAALRSDFMTAIGSRCAMHPERAVLAAATASGRANVWRNEK